MRVLVVEDHAPVAESIRSDARGAQVRRQRRGATAKPGSIISCAAATTRRSSTSACPAWTASRWRARRGPKECKRRSSCSPRATPSRIALPASTAAPTTISSSHSSRKSSSLASRRFSGAPSARCSASSKPERCAWISPPAAVTLRRKAAGPGSDGVSLAGVSRAQRRHRAFARADRGAHLGLRFRRLEQHRRRLRQPASPQAQGTGSERRHRNRVGYRIPLTRRDRSRGGPLSGHFRLRALRAQRGRVRVHGPGVRVDAGARAGYARRAAARSQPPCAASSSRSRRLDAPLVAIVAVASYVLARATIAPLEAARRARAALRRGRGARAALPADRHRRDRAGRAHRSVAARAARRSRAIARSALEASDVVTRFVDARARSGAARTALRAGRSRGNRRETSRDTQPVAQAHGIRLEVSAASAIVDGDERRLRELARNLLENAIRHARASVSIASRRNGRIVRNRRRRRRRRRSTCRARAHLRTILSARRRRFGHGPGARDRALDRTRARRSRNGRVRAERRRAIRRRYSRATEDVGRISAGWARNSPRHAV